MEDILSKAREALESHIQLIVRKGVNMTPPDIDILTKDLCALETLKRIECTEDIGYSETSHRRGRSQTTSRDTNSTRYYDGSGNSGYSGHSIHDRMVAQLERMMSDAKDDYERQQISEFIKKARE